MAVNLGVRAETILQPRQKVSRIEGARGPRGSRRSGLRRSRPALLLLLVATGAVLLLRLAAAVPTQVPAATTSAAAHALHQDPRPVAEMPPASAGSPGSHESPGGSEARARVWIVARGETLWSIARQIAPDHDPRSVVEALRRVNRLESAALRVGQALQLPPEIQAR